MKQHFKIGDDVILKSGGYVMTITRVRVDSSGSLSEGEIWDGKYECKWTENNFVQCGCFHQDLLESFEYADFE